MPLLPVNTYAYLLSMAVQKPWLLLVCAWSLGGCPHSLHPTLPLVSRELANLVLSAGLSVPWTQGPRSALDHKPEPGASSGTCWEAPPRAGRSLQMGWVQMLWTQTRGESEGKSGKGRSGLTQGEGTGEQN